MGSAEARATTRSASRPASTASRSVRSHQQASLGAAPLTRRPLQGGPAPGPWGTCIIPEPRGAPSPPLPRTLPAPRSRRTLTRRLLPSTGPTCSLRPAGHRRGQRAHLTVTALPAADRHGPALFTSRFSQSHAQILPPGQAGSQTQAYKVPRRGTRGTEWSCKIGPARTKASWWL